MTGTDIEQRDEQPAGQVATISANVGDLDRVARLGKWLAAAESDSKDPNAKGMAAALRIVYAESIGLPAHAAAEVHVIGGNLSLSAKLCRARANEYGVRVEAVDASETSCTAVVYEHGKELGRRTFTIEDAARRGLLDRPGKNWKTMPDRMLWARASKMALDDLAPWTTVGVLSHEQASEAYDVEVLPFEEGD